MPPDLDRRALLRAAAAGLLVSGCQGTESRTEPSARPSPPPRRGSPSPTPEPPPAAYVPLPGEAVPLAKQTAAGFIQALLTGDGRAGAEAGLARAAALTGLGFDAQGAADMARPAFADALSRAEVVYPQIGGLVPDGQDAVSAAVMVVVRHRLTSSTGQQQEVVRVCDVRLAVQDGTWKVVELASIGGEPVDRPPSLDPRAGRVLDDPRVDLPDSCRWDVHSGRVSLDLLDVLADAARVAPLSVTVLRSGHPPNVFGTDRTSDHTQGRAVDVWRIDGRPVVETGAASGAAGQVLRGAFADSRLAQAGSPVGSDLDGPDRRRSFVNLVHKDHLHLATRGDGRAPTAG